MAAATVQSNEHIPFEFYKTTNIHLWTDLSKTAKDSERSSSRYVAIYSSSPYIAAAVAVSGLALTFFYAPPFITLTAFALFIGIQITFEGIRPWAKGKALQFYHRKVEALSMQAQENTFERSIESWDNVKEHLEALGIPVRRAETTCRHLSPDAPHKPLLRALAIEAVLRKRSDTEEGIYVTHKRELEQDQHDFLTKQFTEPSDEVDELRANLKEKRDLVFQKENAFIYTKIRAAFARAVLERPDDVRTIAGYGECIVKQREETVEEFDYTGVSLAFAKKESDGTVTPLHRDWILTESIQTIAERIFETESA